MSKLPSTGSSLLQYLRAQKRQALRQAQSSAFTRSGISIDGLDAATVSGVTLADQVADLAAQVSFLAGQSFSYTSAKDWSLQGTPVSGTGGWEFLTFDPTYDDEYTFQASSTGILKIEISATVLINNGSATLWGGTARGYNLSWAGGGWLPAATMRSALVSGINCGAVQVTSTNMALVTVTPGATVTLRTFRIKQSTVAPATTWHEVRDTTVVVTRVGI